MPRVRPPVRTPFSYALRGRIWAVVLAGGEGVRLRPLVRLVHGDDRPKQYARLLGARSLLRQTLERVALGVPVERTVVVTQERHEHYLACEFRGTRLPHLLRQPEDRGTAAGILLPVHWISWRDPRAVVIVFPSDHFVIGEAAFIRHVLEVAALVRAHPERLVVVGAPATAPETQYGWVERGPRCDGIDLPAWDVVRFREKPDAETAQACWVDGALWNTFVLVGTAQTFLARGSHALPDLSDRLARIQAFAGTADERWAIQQAYSQAPKANFSRAVLEAVPPGLTVSQLPASVTWSDWGSPARVVRSLGAAGLEPPWLARLAGVDAFAPP